MHLYHILINWSQKFWVVYVQYRFIYEQCEIVGGGIVWYSILILTTFFAGSGHFCG